MQHAVRTEDFLVGWKEIALATGRSINTLRKLAQEENFPVYTVANKPTTTLALINQWLMYKCVENGCSFLTCVVPVPVTEAADTHKKIVVDTYLRFHQSLRTESQKFQSKFDIIREKWQQKLEDKSDEFIVADMDISESDYTYNHEEYHVGKEADNEWRKNAFHCK